MMSTPNLNHYRIIKELGRGSMGTVYLVEHTLLQRQMALKVPHLVPSRPDLRERFYREARVTAALEHSNICPVFEVGEKDGMPYLVMAYIEGKSLAELICREKSLPQFRAAQIAYKLASALEVVHRQYIVHRHLTPPNVMINRRGEPILIDFGLARFLDQGTHRIRQGAVIGTPAYMPPEQAVGAIDLVGPASDQYSLGVILYELLTGEMPFKGNVAQVMMAVLTKKAAPPSALRPDLDPILEKACLKAMAPEINDRYPSMAEFGAALARFAGAESSSRP
jgi:serine/threonine protein kinase